mgnify:CR=1 FL=1
MSIIKEKLIESSPKPITIQGTEIILSQMKNSICKIYKCNGTGFFCNIIFQNFDFKVLITNYHIIDEKYIEDNKIIKISLNDEKEKRDIELNKRKIYFNNKYDITIIEIKNSDNINVNYLKLDEKIFEDNSEFYYENKSIYLLHYPNQDKASVSYGITKKIDNDNINHLCSTLPGSSGSPIMDLSNNTIIGIHSGASKFDFNKGWFIKNPINEFIQNEHKNRLDNNNIINITNNDKNIKSSKNEINYKQIDKMNNKYENKKILNPNIKIIQKEDKSKSDNKIINKRNNDKQFKSTENKIFNRFLDHQINIISDNFGGEKLFDENAKRKLDKRYKINNFNNGIGMRFNNSIKSGNFMNHKRSTSNNKTYKNSNLNNISNNNIILRPRSQENYSNIKSKKYPNMTISNVKIYFKFNEIIKSPSTNGLEYIEATCYMNSTLQCMAHIKYLTKYLFDNSNNISANKSKYQLTNAYTEVLKNLWQNNNIKYYSPIYFKDTISKMNPLFAMVQDNDSKDLVLFLIETMHNELNIPNKNMFFYKISSIPNQYNYEITFNLFSEYFTKNYNSVISNLFYGMYNSMMKCLNCNIVSHNVQFFNILIFPLEEVRKFKNRENKIVDIKECFEYYQKYEYMQIYCNNCNLMSDSCNQIKLIICPNILVVILNRGKGLEFDVKLNFEEYLNIKEFVYYINTSPTNYELIGIATRYGSGHFIAFCKSFVDHLWYKYNDIIVNLSSFTEASTTGIPYILFYSKIN